MNIDNLILQVDEFAYCIDSNDLDGAKKIDAVLIEYLGKDDRVVPRKDAPPFCQIMYAYNRSMFRLNADEIESAVLAMVDVAEIIRCYELWDEVYHVLWMLAENKGRHDQFDQALQFACDNLMMGIVCQIKFPALSLSFLWNAEKSFVKFGRMNTAEFIKGFRQLQYRLIAFEYKNLDINGALLFEEKANTLGKIKMKLPSKDELKSLEHQPIEQEVISADLRNIFKGMNEHIPTLNEWASYWSSFPDYKVSDSMLMKKFGHFSNEEIEKLPNLLELLEALSYDEEKYALIYDKSPLGVSFPFHEEWNDLDKITNNDNELLFLPRCRVKNWYYRGQTRYYANCLPTLQRDNDKYIIFKERLKLCEFSIIVKKHPIANMFDLGLFTQTRSGDMQHCKIHINDVALAQHYGIFTEHLDLTTDKWVAAFFASSDYVNGEGLKKDSYKPHEGKDFGVLYLFRDKSPLEDNWHLHPVGIQPNARPSKQSAYTMDLGRNQNFNDLAYGFRFKHESRCSSIIYKLFDESKGILPPEVIEQKVKEIVGSNKFSQMALDSVRKKFYSHFTDSDFNELLAGSSVEIVSKPIVEYLPEELEEANREFELVDKFVRFNTSNYLFGSFRIDN